jgi:2-polyprenyl-3-methyl-5-hydroxy-6-metoxy-1,4-benzoquinol methylase
MEKKYYLYSDQEPKTQEEVKEVIDEYNEAIKNNRFTRYRYILQFIPSNMKVLDYGCGWGCMTKAIAEKGNEVVGIDQSEGVLEVARTFNSHKNVTFLKKSIGEFSDETFDLVNSNQVLEHVQNPGIYLKNCNRVLRKGGYLIISIPNVINLAFLCEQLSTKLNDKFKTLARDVLNNYSKESHHVQAWDPASFVRLLGSTGFEYIEHRFLEGMLLPFGKCQHSKVPWGGRYFHTRNERLRNLSYTMLFKMKKVRFISVAPED